MKMLGTFLIGLSCFLLFPICVSANQWVYGKVTMLEEYGNYSNGDYQVLITLKDKVWIGNDSGDGSTECTDRLRVKIGFEGVDENIKNRIFTMMLSAYMADKRVGLFVNTSTCNVQIGRIGDGF